MGREGRESLSLESAEGVSEPEPAYLELQAEVGISKHMGGLKATEELVELCNIGKGKYVLDVGCGTGKTSCFLAKKYGCRVVGVDTSEKMLDWSKERAKEEGVDSRVEFRVADAQNLPFEDNSFDAVICESVNAFIKNKQRALSEYVRVTKPGGYVGLNESTWIKEPPTELVEYFSSTVEEVEILTPDGWKELMENAGLRDIVVTTYKVNFLSDIINRIKLVGFRRILRAWSLVITNPACRSWIKKMSTPKNTYEYYGYGIYVGRK